MSSLAPQSGVPGKCTACDGAIPSGRDRCPSCGKIYGEWNRCPSCHAIAAVHESRPGVYVCAACSAPRKRQRGTPVDAEFAAELRRRSLFSRGGSWALWLASVGLIGTSTVVLALGLLFDGAVAYTSGLAAILAVPGLSASLFAWRLGKRSRALAEQARQERLLSHVLRARAAVTAGEAAQALHLLPVEADAALTALAKRGRLDLDVDERGTVRYRVLTEEELRRRGLEAQGEEDEGRASVHDRFGKHE